MAIQHTQGKWRVKESGRCICSPDKTICQLTGIEDGALAITPEVEANATLICDAVNNTAGKGIDPNAVEGLLTTLKTVYATLKKDGLRPNPRNYIELNIKAAELK